MRTGVNWPSIAADACTATPASPAVNATTEWSRCRVATQAIGTGMSSSSRLRAWRCTRSATGAPLKRWSDQIARRAMWVGCRSSASVSISAPGMPDARRQPTSAPTDAPTIRSGFRSSSSSAFNTPTCTKPRGPPELNTHAICGVCPSGAARGASAPSWSASGDKRAAGDSGRSGADDGAATAHGGFDYPRARGRQGADQPGTPSMLRRRRATGMVGECACASRGSATGQPSSMQARR